MYYRIGRVAVVSLALVASIPLSLLAIERGFGLAATLSVPTCCLGLCLSLVSARRAQRIGWFAFSAVCVFFLPLCPWWQRQIEATLNWAQGFLRGSPWTFLYSGAEAVAHLVLIILPWSVGCGLGWLAAKIARTLFDAPMSNVERSQESEYRFTLRGMLISIAICAALTAWLSNTIRQWHAREQTNQQLFLQRFTRSFTTGNVTLLAPPEMTEDHTFVKTIRSTSSIREYRVTAPIGTTRGERWGVWTYLCDERYPGTVSKFGYAEAATRNGLPSYPFPVAEYLREPNNNMVDGEPQLDTRAEVINAPTVARAADTITIVAKTDEFLECNLFISPFQAISLPAPKQIAPPSGVVRWDIKLDPAFRGSRIDYEFQARTHMGYRAKTVAGAITLDR